MSCASLDLQHERSQPEPEITNKRMTSSLDKAPRLSTEEAARIGAELYGLTAVAEPLTSERDQNFLLKDSGGNRFVLKIANAEENPAFLDLQNRLIQFLGNAHLKTEIPRVVVTKAGEPTATIPGKNGRPAPCSRAHLARGHLHCQDPRSWRGFVALVRSRACRNRRSADRFSHPAAQRKFYWDLQHADMAFEHLDLLPADRRGLVESFFAEWRRIDWKQFRQSVIQNDASDYNILVNSDDSTGQRVTSILDYGDVVHTATACELAVAMAYVMLDKPDPIAAAAQVVAGYHEVYPLTEAEVDALYTLAVTRLCCSVCFAEHQKRQAPDNEYLNISNAPAWALLTKLEGRSPDWPRQMFRFACGFPVVKAFHPVPRRSSTDLLTSRRRHIGPSLSLAYQRPLHVVSGSRQYLYDSDGRRYLDCVNNVAHVGHSHPRVVRAASEQMAILNTNTRYVHELLVEYAERLTKMLPDQLSVAYLVCTGSEANELALRLARAHTRKDEVIVVQAGYHGNTNAMVDMSPYKFDGRGRGRPAHVHKVPMPDVYRGPHRGEDAGGSYAQYVADAAQENKKSRSLLLRVSVKLWRSNCVASRLPCQGFCCGPCRRGSVRSG